MTGVTLRYKWITLAMFTGPGLEPVLPSGRLSQKMYTYHLDRAPLAVKNTQSVVCYYEKKPGKRSEKKLPLPSPAQLAEEGTLFLITLAAGWNRLG